MIKKDKLAYWNQKLILIREGVVYEAMFDRMIANNSLLANAEALTEIINDIEKERENHEDNQD